MRASPPVREVRSNFHFCKSMYLLYKANSDPSGVEAYRGVGYRHLVVHLSLSRYVPLHGDFLLSDFKRFRVY